MKEVEYASSLKQSATHLRKICSKYMEQVYGRPTRQPDWRASANVYAKHNGPGINSDHMKWEFPVPIASTRVDTYHHGNFIRAVLAAVYYPDEEPIYVDYILSPICTTEPNELVRREHQVAFYTRLAELIPQQSTKAPISGGVTLALQQINQKLDEVLRCLHGIHTDSPHPSGPDPNKAVVPTGDPSRKLDSQQPPKSKGRHKRTGS